MPRKTKLAQARRTQAKRTMQEKAKRGAHYSKAEMATGKKLSKPRRSKTSSVGLVIGIPSPRQVMASVRRKKKSKQAGVKRTMKKAGY